MPVGHAVRCPYSLAVSLAFDVHTVVVSIKSGHLPEFVFEGIGKLIVGEAGADAL